MSETPKGRVHWAASPDIVEFGSPLSEGSSSESSLSTSSLQYINSQLVAHGFTHNPGISLDGLQREDSERLVKCLLGMLGQRIDDMSRAEDLSAKIRTLTYEHERVSSMHRAAQDKAANAERETSTHKSKLASTTLTLQNAENAHKRTTAELQRMRTAFQGLRSQHQAEIKKMEKEKERFMERWNKLADNQAKLNTIASGISFANAQVVEASDVQLRGKGQGFLEISLEQAERSRGELADEVRNLRSLALSTANELQRILYTARKLSSSGNIEEPPPITSIMLFPLAPVNAARDKINSLLGSMKEMAERLAHAQTFPQLSSAAVSLSKQEVTQKDQVDRVELARLQDVVKTLRKELEEAQKQSSGYAARIQELSSRSSEDRRSARERDEATAHWNAEKERLGKKVKELEEDSRQSSEANAKLRSEKATIEEERQRLSEEKRSWQLSKVFSEASAPLASSPPSQPLPVVQELRESKSPRKSPRKTHKAKTSSSGVLTKADKKSARISRHAPSLIPPSPKGQANVIPAFETEVVPSTPVSIPEFKLSMKTTQAQPPPTTSTFILPPPSPAASFRPQDAFLSSAFAPPIPKLDIPPLATNNIPTSRSDTIAAQASGSSGAPETETPESSNSIPSSSSAPSGIGIPSTPLNRRSFPMAKPLASHMTHAYSPAKPSPLSRILMLANSPESPEGLLAVPSLGSLSEENESPEVSPTPAMSLAAELGILEAEREEVGEAPLGKKTSRSSHADHKMVSSKTKGKGRADSKHILSSRARGAAAGEKENKVKLSKAEPEQTKTGLDIGKRSSRTSSSSKPAIEAGAPQVKIVPKVKGGARRVPIESAEAAVVAPTWKG